MPTRPTATRPAFTWCLRIELLDVVPTVVRRLLVPERITLPKLHQAIQAAMGWTDSHLHEFIVRGVRYGMRDVYDDDPPRDERRVTLDKALDYQTRCFEYVYDFGDHWHHVVIVESDYVYPPPASAIVLVEGVNACPPEDVGGAGGYATFLEALADPFHEEHETYRTWIGGDFDPTHFDPNAVNALLAKIKA
jgi:hypothetical protein